LLPETHIIKSKPNGMGQSRDDYCQSYVHVSRDIAVFITIGRNHSNIYPFFLITTIETTFNSCIVALNDWTCIHTCPIEFEHCKLSNLIELGM